MFNNELFKNKLIAARTSKGLSREDLALKVGFSKDTIDLWEQGKRVPKFPDVVSLSQILDKPIEYFNTERTSDMLTEKKIIINPNASKPILFEGANEVLNGWATYYHEYDTICRLSEASDEITNWRDSNIFLNCINTKTKKVCAIRDFGMYLPDATDYLFKTELLPLYTHQPTSSCEELIDIANKTLELFNSEINNMKSACEYPVFLLHYCGTNNYIAWSLTEEKELYIFNYKKYLTSFSFADIDVQNIENIIENSKYTIIPPSQELIEALGLTLYPSIWENKMAWDEWAPRSPKEYKTDLIPEIYHDIYKSAVTAINKSHSVDLGYDEEFEKLESRTARLERLCVLCAPAEIIEKEINLVQKAYDIIAHLIA